MFDIVFWTLTVCCNVLRKNCRIITGINGRFKFGKLYLIAIVKMNFGR